MASSVTTVGVGVVGVGVVSALSFWRGGCKIASAGTLVILSKANHSPLTSLMNFWEINVKTKYLSLNIVEVAIVYVMIRTVVVM